MMIGMAPADPSTAVPEAVPTPEIEGMQVELLDGMEIDGEEDYRWISWDRHWPDVQDQELQDSILQQRRI